MKRRIKNVTRMASQLTDPKPEFVSLVGHGANQTPLRTLKADVFDARNQLSEDDMPAEVQKFMFTAAKFNSVDAVEGYLTAKGYSDFEVTKTKKGYSVVAKDEKDFEGGLKEIEGDAGVTMLVGKLAEGAAALATVTEKVEKQLVVKGLDGEAIVKKYYDCCGPCYPTWVPPAGKTVADVLSETYNEGTFPAMYDIENAFVQALRNLVKDGDTSKVKALCAELGDLIVAILTALETAGVDTKAVKQLLLAEPEKDKGMTKEPKETKKDETEVKKADAAAPAATQKDETGAAEEAAQPAGTEAQDTGEAAPAEPEQSADGGVAKAIADALSPFATQMEAMTKAMADIATAQKAATDGLAELQTQVSKASERVDSLETARQTRKSADDDGVGTGTKAEKADPEVEKTQKAFQDRVQRDLLGY